MKLLTLEILNRMLNIFGLVLTDIGLFYEHKLRFGSVMYFVTDDYSKVIEFLGLPYEPDNSIESLFYAVSNSDYFHVESFVRYREGSDEYNKFVKFLKSKHPVSFYRPTYIANWGAIKADTFFGSNILSKVLSLGTNLGITNKSLKNKFNGHLVKKWTGMTDGPLLADTMQEFKEHIADKKGYSFLDYINNFPPKIIESDFKVFYFAQPIVEDLPF